MEKRERRNKWESEWASLGCFVCSITLLIGDENENEKENENENVNVNEIEIGWYKSNEKDSFIISTNYQARLMMI